MFVHVLVIQKPGNINRNTLNYRTSGNWCYWILEKPKIKFKLEIQLQAKEVIAYYHLFFVSNSNEEVLLKMEISQWMDFENSR